MRNMEKALRQTQGKKVAILGFGREGRSILKFFQNRGLTRTKPRTRTAEIWILDENPRIKISSRHSRLLRRGSPSLEAAHLKISHRLGKNYLKNLKRFDIIFRSPGIPYTLPQLYRARCEGIEVSSATKLFFQETINYKLKTKNHKPILIGVTGTKGKGTTSTLLAAILKNSGYKVVLAGNIGKPMLDILPQAKKADFVILELSSFQLQDLPHSPDIAVVLDVFPDHLDQHKSIQEYYGSKANIGRFQKKSDAIFYFADNKITSQIAAKSPAHKFPIQPLKNDLTKNSFMAAAVARQLHAPEAIIEKTIKNFRGLEHRLEYIRSIRIGSRTNADRNARLVSESERADQRGQFPRKSASSRRKSAIVKFVNDSAATNPEATAMAIKTLSHIPNPAPLILIAGGKDKGLDYKTLAKEITKSHTNSAPPPSGSGNANAPTRIKNGVQAVILFGENRKKIYSEIKKLSNLEIKIAQNLKSAVESAYKIAKTLAAGGYTLNPIILFSPASASFDMFKDYQDRGEQFKKFARLINL